MEKQDTERQRQAVVDATVEHYLEHRRAADAAQIAARVGRSERWVRDVMRICRDTGFDEPGSAAPRGLVCLRRQPYLRGSRDTWRPARWYLAELLQAARGELERQRRR